jgi:hypothetical protein
MTNIAERNRGRISPEGYDLFAVFSRFEYAMKKGGFRRQENAEAAWHSFAARLPENFFERMRNAPEAAIYFTAPPKMLERDVTGGVRWSEGRNPPRSTSDLFDCIKTARNNLFHGDKQHDNQRDAELMLAALFILQSAYDDACKTEGFAAFVTHMDE